jgi:hypothetical protein
VFTLNADSSLRSLAVLAVVVAMLTAWVAWFAGARVVVETERVSLAKLVLRSAGVWTRERAAATPVAP